MDFGNKNIDKTRKCYRDSTCFADNGQKEQIIRNLDIDQSIKDNQNGNKNMNSAQVTTDDRKCEGTQTQECKGKN